MNTGSAVVKILPASVGDARDAGSIPVSGRPPAGRNGNSLQYSCLKNSMDRGAYSPWGRKELDMTKHACLLSHSLISSLEQRKKIRKIPFLPGHKADNGVIQIWREHI